MTLIVTVLLLLGQASACVYGALKHRPLWYEKSLKTGRIMAVAYVLPVLWAVWALAVLLLTDRSTDSIDLVVKLTLVVCFLWIIILVCTMIMVYRELIFTAAYILCATVSNTLLVYGIAEQGAVGVTLIMLGYMVGIASVGCLIAMLGNSWLDRLTTVKAGHNRKSVRK